VAAAVLVSGGASLIGGGFDDVLQHRGGEGSQVRPREEDEDDRSSELTARMSQWRHFGIGGGSGVLL
jgi:hypothetical protein